MDLNNFWQIIDVGKNAEEPEGLLRQELEKLPPEEIESFQEHFDTRFDLAYQWDLWGAAYLVHGGCSDDGFTDFRYALIAKGKDLFEKTLDNPDTLADLGEDGGSLDNEMFGYVAGEVYEAKTGKDLPPQQSAAPSDPAGEDWDFDDEAENKRRFPKLYSVHGG